MKYDGGFIFSFNRLRSSVIFIGKMRWTQSLLTSYCLLVTSWVSGERLGTPIKNNPAASVTSAPPVIDPNKPASSRKFLFHSQLDENYDLFWDFNDTHITFETLVKTNGYIGFGISDSGSMFPSDVIIGWVKDGHNHFSDRHANGHFMPAKDTVQHWLLLGGMEQGQYTRLTFVRPLDSCDSQDKPIKAFDYPLIAGQSMGTAGDPGYFKMETHYDNPDMRADFVDNSGIRIFLTQQLRTHDAGVLEVGVNVDPYQIVPPNNPSFLSTGHCHPNCLSEGLGGQEIRVFSNLLHAHLIGVKLRTRHFRNGVELQPIGEDNNYDFNFQEQRYLPQERVVKAGDYLVTECVYDSRGRAGLTLCRR
ncbi:DBH-like monooxygenase protein 1 homolog [Aplysia californica]|uniref:DBH-like monooxygenase protein 1 homolog n=1 Tax=Aplysia californica TaxID=6500 RepID=A0ABM1VPM8_APLCA|nr:DBH-like monooxygenase protein 1 homolog [Aplysia californica]